MPDQITITIPTDAIRFTLPGDPKAQKRHKHAKRGDFVHVYNPSAADKHTIEVTDLGLSSLAETPTSSLGSLDRPLAEARDEFIRHYVSAVLEQHGNDRESAAAALGIGVRSLYRYIA